MRMNTKKGKLKQKSKTNWQNIFTFGFLSFNSDAIEQLTKTNTTWNDIVGDAGWLHCVSGANNDGGCLICGHVHHSLSRPGQLSFSSTVTSNVYCGCICQDIIVLVTGMSIVAIANWLMMMMIILILMIMMVAMTIMIVSCSKLLLLMFRQWNASCQNGRRRLFVAPTTFGRFNATKWFVQRFIAVGRGDALSQ